MVPPASARSGKVALGVFGGSCGRGCFPHRGATGRSIAYGTRRSKWVSAAGRDQTLSAPAARPPCLVPLQKRPSCPFAPVPSRSNLFGRTAAAKTRPGTCARRGARHSGSLRPIFEPSPSARTGRLRCGARHMTLARRARFARRLRPPPEAPRRPPAPSSPNPRLRAGPGTPPKSHRILCEIYLINQ